MSASLQLKFYKDDEIRRASLPREFLSYAALQSTAKSALGLPPTAPPLRLRWLDADDDKVSVDTDAEVAEVARLTPQDQTVKIFVSAADAFEAESISHPGVVCDACNASLRGYRYKCLLCPDYDLCSGCLATNEHSQHPMLLIRRPTDVGRGFGGGWRRFGGHCHAQPPGCRRRWSEKHCHGWQQQQQQQPQQQQHEESQEKQQQQQQPDQQGLHHLLQQATSAINAFMQPFGIDATFEMAPGNDEPQQQQQQQQQQPEQQQQPAAAAPEDTSVEAAIEASLLTEAAKIDAACSSPAAEQQPKEPQQQQPEQEQQQPEQQQQQQQQQQSPSDFEMLEAADSGVDGQNAKVARAVEHMKAMGFTDDGGWLTRLLVAKGGDICAVLDAIRPVK